MDDDYIISVIFERLLKTISRYHISNDSNNSLDIFIDIANDLIENYFYILYLRSKNKYMGI